MTMQPLGADARRPFLGHTAEPADIRQKSTLGEVERLEVLAFERLVAERDLDADRAARGERVTLR